MKVLVVHPGTQHSFQLVKQLEKNNVLFKFCTGFALFENSVFDRLIKSFSRKLYDKFKKRRIKNIPPQKLSVYWFPEIYALLLKKTGFKSETVFFWRNKLFQQLISDRDILNCDVVIGFDTSSWILEKRCKQLKRHFILDVSIGHPASKERIFKQLAIEYPEWKLQIQPKSEFLISLEKLEMEMADKIVVPSDFVKTTYAENGIPDDKIFINPFGTDFNIIEAINIKKRKNKIRFLFFGGLTARKGLPFLLSAWEQIDPDKAELIIAGFGKIPDTIELKKNVFNKGFIAKNKRESLYAEADVFVFPSFFEGFAQVQIEAATCGLPLIGTFNSGGAEIIQDGVNGFLVEPGNKINLIQSMQYFINHPDDICRMGKKSLEKSKRFTWNNYGERWQTIINLLN